MEPQDLLGKKVIMMGLVFMVRTVDVTRGLWDGPIRMNVEFIATGERADDIEWRVIDEEPLQLNSATLLPSGEK